MHAELTVVGSHLHDGERLLGRFSSHSAAFQAMQRLHQPDWAPLQEAFTPEDWQTLAEIREVPA